MKLSYQVQSQKKKVHINIYTVDMHRASNIRFRDNVKIQLPTLPGDMSSISELLPKLQQLLTSLKVNNFQ